MPSLPLLSTSVVSFANNSNNTNIKIFVDSVLLGSINNNFPVTIFVTNTGGSKTITLEEITSQQYTAGNKNKYGIDTFLNAVADAALYFSFGVCGGSNESYKIIGWDEEVTGQICIAGSHGFSQYFGTNSSLELKCKTEEFDYKGTTKWRMVSRYGSNVNHSEAIATATSYSGSYCYACNP